MENKPIRGKVLKPIPGTGYSIGDEADFDNTASQWLLEGKYIESLEEKKSKDAVKPETATKKAPENAAKPNNK